jgi:hypothetical protein
VRRRVGVGVGLVGVIMLLLIGPAGGSVPAAGDIEVTGEVDGLYPGVVKMLDVRVTNPQPFTIRVTSVATAVDSADPSCPGSMLDIGGVRAPVDVPSGATGTVPIAVHMDGNAPESCQGVTFTLDFVATATDTVTDAGGSASQSSPHNSAGQGRLAFTGTEIVKVLAVALALVALGVLARRAAHHRRGTAR